MFPAPPSLTILRSAPLFSLLDEDSEGLALLSAAAEPVEYPPAEVLFREGDPGDCLYLLVTGALRILKDHIPVMTLRQPGTCIGEMALITEETRSATVETIESSALLRISRDDFYLALEADTSIARGVFSALNRKLRENLVFQMTVERREIARKESLRMAAEVQQSLLPRQEVVLPRICTSGYCRPADLVGGDYYDYLTLPDGKLAIFFADVMDHGLHSAMLMAMLKSGVHTQLSFDPSVDGVLRAVHRIVEEDVGIFIYLSCCYVLIDPDAREMEYLNAGNPPMLLYRAADRQILELESTLSPPGLLPADSDGAYTALKVAWQPGDTLLIYSDGLSEAQDPSRQMYGLQRITSVLHGASDLEPQAISTAILADLETFLGNHRRTDDLTLVVAKAC
jgi:sigma-B regulation protein RsbU (phosphoserine phosphatase)